MNQVNIPVEIDSPHQVLLWELDEFISFMLFIIAGNLFGEFFLGCGIGWVVSHLYRRYKNTRPDGFLLHLIYWIGIPIGSEKTFINPYKKEFLP
jgi:conjugal transfer pilus assembly protein TraL